LNQIAKAPADPRQAPDGNEIDRASTVPDKFLQSLEGGTFRILSAVSVIPENSDDIPAVILGRLAQLPELVEIALFFRANTEIERDAPIFFHSFNPKTKTFVRARGEPYSPFLERMQYELPGHRQYFHARS
jgi:hypothetical protein